MDAIEDRRRHLLLAAAAMGGEGLSGVRVRENNTGCGSTPRVFSG